jgi:hypothetical protein
MAAYNYQDKCTILTFHSSVLPDVFPYDINIWVLCPVVVQAVTSYFVITNYRYTGDCEWIVPKYSSQKKLSEFRTPCCWRVEASW